MSAISNLSETAEDILAVCVAALGARVPARQYIAAGLVSYDGCIPANALVSLTRGAVPISEVVPGDEAWTWEDGVLSTRTVLASACTGTKPVVAIRTGHRTIRATADHRLLVLRPTQRGPNKRYGASQGRVATWSPEWVAAGAVQPEDVLVTLAHIPDCGEPRYLPDGTEITPDVAWFFGVFIGDGCMERNGIHICVFGELRDRVAHFLRETWGVKCYFSDHYGIRVNARRLAAMFAEMGLWVRAHEKHIPSWFWALSQKGQRAFLQGYADADGHHDKHGYQAYASCSWRLLAEARAAHIHLGDVVSNINTYVRPHLNQIKGKRQMVTGLPLHSFRVFPNTRRVGSGLLDRRGARHALPDDAFTAEMVRGVTELPPTDVYDLTIEDTANFIADGVVVHNCEQLTVSLVAPGLYIVDPFPSRSNKPVRCAAVLAGDFIVESTRCMPVIQGDVPPDPTVLTSASEEMMADAETLLCALLSAGQAGTLFGGCRLYTLGPATPYGPSGAVGAVRIPITVQMTCAPVGS